MTSDVFTMATSPHEEMMEKLVGKVKISEETAEMLLDAMKMMAKMLAEAGIAEEMKSQFRRIGDNADTARVFSTAVADVLPLQEQTGDVKELIARQRAALKATEVIRTLAEILGGVEKW